MYVNDAIGYKMTPEMPLFYSYNCYGTADTIAYKKNVLRIHDYKSGEVEAHMKQLYIYAALFCLQYSAYRDSLRKKGKTDKEIANELELSEDELHFQPEMMNDIVLRIYQFNEVKEEHADPAAVRELMDIIVHDDRILNNLKAEE